MRRFYDSLLALTEKYYWIFFTLAAGMLAFLCFRCLGVARSIHGTRPDMASPPMKCCKTAIFWSTLIWVSLITGM